MAASTLPFGQRIAISPGEAAALLGVSETYIREQIALGTIPASRMGRRWLIPRQVIEAYGRPVQPVAQEIGRPIGRRTG